MRVNLTEIGSTNDFAKALLVQKPTEGSIVLAESQTAGRGQQNAHWQSEPKKNLTFSIILYPKFIECDKIFRLNQCVALAIADAIEELLLQYAQKVKIKWPNDILCANAKLAGILIENQIQGKNIESSIIGIGLNVNQTNFSGEFNLKPTSLALIGKTEFELELVLTLILEKLRHYYEHLQNSNASFIKLRYIKRLYRLNELAKYSANDEVFYGEIVGVSEEGFLQVIKAGSLTVYKNKEIKYL